MKKLILLLAIGTIVVSCGKPAKYEIRSNGSNYQTNSYSTNADGCIVFKNECGCGGEPEVVTVCGDYSIVKNKRYESK
jgi:hypothetical protein